MDWSAIISTLDDQVGTLNREHHVGDVKMHPSVALTGGYTPLFLKSEVFASSQLWRKSSELILDHLYGQTDIFTNHLIRVVVCVTASLDLASSLDGFSWLALLIGRKNNGIFFWN